MAGETTYTIRLIDNASVSSGRVRESLKAVEDAAIRTANAFGTTDRAYQAVARRSEQQARVQLKAARAIAAVDNAALKHQRTLDKMNGRRTPKAPAGMNSPGAIRATTAFIVGAITGAGAAMARSFLESAAAAQQFDRGLSDLSKGDKTLSPNWERELRRLNVDLTEGRQSVTRLLASLKEVPNLNAGIAVNDILKLGSALQLSSEQAARLNKVFSDTAGKGKIQREELTTQLAEIGIGVTIPGFLREVAARTKKSYAEAEKMLSTGKITADIAVPALIDATMKARGITDLDKSADQGAQGLSGQLTALDNSITKIKENLGKALDQSGFLKDINTLAGSVESLTSNLGGLVTALKALAEGFKLASAPIAWIAGQTLGRVAFTVEDTRLDAEARQRRRQTDHQDRVNLYDQLPDAARTAGQDFGAGLGMGIEASRGAAEEAAANLGAGVIEATKTELDTHSPSRVMMGVGADFDQGFVNGVEDHQDLAFAAAESMADGAIAEAEMAAATGAPVSASHMANVGAAAGGALAAGGGSGSGPVTAQISITVDGSRSPEATVGALQDFFSSADFVALFERAVEGSGA